MTTEPVTLYVRPPDRTGTTMPKRVLRMVTRSFRTPAARYPADPRAVFILIVCLFNGIPLAMGRATPGSINDQIHQTWQIVVWGLFLVIGSGCTLLGTFNQSVNGILLEQTGSVAVGFACLIYAAAIRAQVGVAGSVPAGIVLAFGIACLWRWGQLQGLIIEAERQATHAREEADWDGDE